MIVSDARRSELDWELDWELGDGSDEPRSDEQAEQQPGKANEGAYRERKQFELPNLGAFAKILHDFIRSTRPARYSRARIRRLLRDGRVGPVSPLASVTEISSA